MRILSSVAVVFGHYRGVEAESAEAQQHLKTGLEEGAASDVG